MSDELVFIRDAVEITCETSEKAPHVFNKKIAIFDGIILYSGLLIESRIRVVQLYFLCMLQNLIEYCQSSRKLSFVTWNRFTDLSFQCNQL